MSIGKKLVAALGVLTLSTSAMAASATYICEDKNGTMRQHGEKHPARARLTLSLLSDSEKPGLNMIVDGGIAVEYDFNYEGANEELKFEDYHYQGLFKSLEVSQNLKYKPRKYKKHYQFKDVDSKDSSTGMWGNLVIPKTMNPENKKFAPNSGTVHYIFQAGDHMGGTLDLTCRKIVKHILPRRR